MADTKVAPPGACPSSESLAAYLDGTLSADGRATIEAHLAECDDCREIGAESIVALDEGIALDRQTSPANVIDMRPARRRWRWPVVALAAAAAAVTVAVLVPALQAPADPSARPELAALVAAVGEHRPFEPRLTGGFKYGPLAPVMRSGGQGATSAPPAVEIAAAELAKAHEANGAVGEMAARATGELILGNVDAAIDLLESASRHDAHNAAYWSDLAASYLVRFARFGDAADAQRARAAADKALALNPSLSEALFNRALALEAALHTSEASEAWRDYLAGERSPEWLEDARKRLAR